MFKSLQELLFHRLFLNCAAITSYPEIHMVETDVKNKLSPYSGDLNLQREKRQQTASFSITSFLLLLWL